jgi:hypothetical protein
MRTTEHANLPQEIPCGRAQLIGRDADAGGEAAAEFVEVVATLPLVVKLMNEVAEFTLTFVVPEMMWSA